MCQHPTSMWASDRTLPVPLADRGRSDQVQGWRIQALTTPVARHKSDLGVRLPSHAQLEPAHPEAHANRLFQQRDVVALQSVPYLAARIFDNPKGEVSRRATGSRLSHPDLTQYST